MQKYVFAQVKRLVAAKIACAKGEERTEVEITEL